MADSKKKFNIKVRQNRGAHCIFSAWNVVQSYAELDVMARDLLMITEMLL
jgi:hypothetical protein